MNPRILVAIGFVALLVLLTVFPRWYFAQPAGRVAASSQNQKMYVAVEENSRDIEAIRIDLDRALGQIARLSKSSAVDGSANDIHGLLQRIESLEEALADLPAGISVEPGTPLANRRGDLVDYSRTAPSLNDRLMPNPAAEELFLADTGKPLGDQAEMIVDVFAGFPDTIDVRDIICRESICKVVYAQVGDGISGMGGIDDAELEIIDTLTDRVGDADLDIRHARDGQGNPVMYIQLR